MFPLILALLLGGFVVLGTPPISLTLNPAVGYAPFSTRGTASIPPSSSNTFWCLVWNSEVGEAGLSCKPLEGEKAPRVHPIELKDLSAGEYEVYVEVETPKGIKVSPRIHLKVLGGPR